MTMIAFKIMVVAITVVCIQFTKKNKRTLRNGASTVFILVHLFLPIRTTSILSNDDEEKEIYWKGTVRLIAVTIIDLTDHFV